MNDNGDDDGLEAALIRAAEKNTVCLGEVCVVHVYHYDGKQFTLCDLGLWDRNGEVGGLSWQYCAALATPPLQAEPP